MTPKRPRDPNQPAEAIIDIATEQAPEPPESTASHHPTPLLKLTTSLQSTLVST
jgi:hypothetical protein